MFRKPLFGLGLALVLSAIYVVVRGLSLYGAANDLQTEFAAIKSQSLTSFGSLQGSLAATQKDLQQIQSVLNDPFASLLDSLPVVGPNVKAGRALVASATDLAESAKPVLAGLDTLQGSLDKSWAVQAKKLSQVRLNQKLAAFSTQLEKTENVLAGLDTRNLDARLGNLIEPAPGAILGVRNIIDQARPLLSLATAIASTPQPQTWFIATQNLAEARGTGGILGSFAVVSISHDKLDLVAAGSDQDLARIGSVDASPLPSRLRTLWGGDPKVWQDMNTSAHVPYFGLQLQQSLKKYLRFDGVIVMGQGTVAKLVAASGPLNVGGVALDSSNVADFLAKGVYAKYPNVAQKNSWVSSFMQTLFRRLTQDKPDLKALLLSATDSTSGDRIAAWSPHKILEAKFVAEGISGRVANKPGSSASFTLNNEGGNKLDAYLGVSAKYSLKKCGELTDYGLLARKASLDLKLTNSAPKKGLPPYVTTRLDVFAGERYQIGQNRTLITVYAPVGSTIDSFSIDGEPALAMQGEDNGHPVWLLDVRINPGQTLHVVANWIQPITDSEGNDIQTSPTLLPPVAFNEVKTAVLDTGFCPVG